MQLLDVYSPTTDYRDAARFLYQMLKDRDPVISINHKSMPGLDQHYAFVFSCPYEAWYIIEHNGEWIGNCYLTKQNEIGIFIMPEYQSKGYGKWAVQEIMRRHGQYRYLANISPLNINSQKFFRALGFSLIQFTYEYDQD